MVYQVILYKGMPLKLVNISVVSVISIGTKQQNPVLALFVPVTVLELALELE